MSASWDIFYKVGVVFQADWKMEKRTLLILMSEGGDIFVTLKAQD